jgi:hypothetical protein
MESIILLSFKVSLVEQMIHVCNINLGGYYHGGRKRRNDDEYIPRWKMSAGIRGDKLISEYKMMTPMGLLLLRRTPPQDNSCLLK